MGKHINNIPFRCRHCTNFIPTINFRTKPSIGPDCRVKYVFGNYRCIDFEDKDLSNETIYY